jgi:hypothetical protein
MIAYNIKTNYKNIIFIVIQSLILKIKISKKNIIKLLIVNRVYQNLKKSFNHA